MSKGRDSGRKEQVKKIAEAADGLGGRKQEPQLGTAPQSPFKSYDNVDIEVDDRIVEVRVTYFSQRLTDSYWEARERGLLHRPDGPALRMEATDPDSGYWSEEWFLFGEQHRKGGPAEIYSTEDYGIVSAWFENGQRHREDGPAAETENGDREFWCRGELHREDGPAIELTNGTKKWFVDGLLHRENDLPAVIEADGTLEWRQHGQLHREHGLPAFISGSGEGAGWWQHGIQFHPNGQPSCITGDGTKSWTDENGRLHQTGDLPAVIGPDKKQWQYHGQPQRERGKPTSIWMFGEREIISWSRPGPVGETVDVADLTMPDYGEPACLTLYSTGPGEIGQFFTTRQGIAWALVDRDLSLGEEISVSYPRLAASIGAAREVIAADPSVDPLDVAYASEDRPDVSSEDENRVFGLA